MSAALEADRNINSDLISQIFVWSQSSYKDRRTFVGVGGQGPDIVGQLEASGLLFVYHPTS